MPTVSVADLAAVAAAIAAIFAAWYSFRSAQAARKAYALAARQDDEHSAGLQIYLIDRTVHRYKAAASRLYEVALQITNLSDVPITVSQIDFELELSRGEGPASHVIFTHEPARAADPQFLRPVFRLPARIEPRDVAVGTAIFRASDDSFRGLRTESYQITVIDSRGRRFTARLISFTEQEHA